MRVRIYQINKKADSLNRYGLPLESAEELQGFPGVDFSVYQKVIDTKVKKKGERSKILSIRSIPARKNI